MPRRATRTSFKKGMHASPATEFKKGHALTRSRKSLPVAKEELERLYWEEGLSTSQIAERLRVPRVVQRWMKRLSIPRRPQSCYHKAGLDRDMLYDLHHNQGLSLTDIARRFGLDDGSMTYRFKKLGILVKGARGKLHPKLSRQALLFLYEFQGLCVREIAELIGCPRSHISRCLRFFDIPARDAHGRLTPRLAKAMGERKKKRWRADKDLRERVIGGLFKARQAKPNKAEQRLTEILKRHNLPFEYVGDGQVVISGLVPDFINTNGRKEIIELFGEYWHKERAVRPTQTEHGRGAIFRRFGFRTLVIWVRELGNEEAVVEKIKAFSHG